ncbi:hypothetical protein K710_0769 [Streptococcus iniae SF1]|nr:hypothetical protein K710_0769 [Streptococcus iniae SF1]
MNLENYYYIKKTLRNTDITVFPRVFSCSKVRKNLKKISQNGRFLQVGKLSALFI